MSNKSVDCFLASAILRLTRWASAVIRAISTGGRGEELGVDMTTFLRRNVVSQGGYMPDPGQMGLTPALGLHGGQAAIGGNARLAMVKLACAVASSRPDRRPRLPGPRPSTARG